MADPICVIWIRAPFMNVNTWALMHMITWNKTWFEWIFRYIHLSQLVLKINQIFAMWPGLLGGLRVFGGGGGGLLQWRHNGRYNVSNHQHHHCLLNRLYRGRSKKTSKLHVTGLCVGNSPVTGELPAQMASSAESVSIWWRHHGGRGRVWESRWSTRVLVLKFL